ncbi:MAG: NAD-dependent epimerase/dehydratase family protein, partial [bacterium]
GEGKYRCHSCGVVSPKLRLPHQLRERDWEMKCPFCGKDVEAMPTDEEKSLYPTSVYAISKRDQEEMCLTVGRAYRLPTVALRYFNVYGSRQALSNPYTGVAAIFSCRILNNNAPHIFEDGGQSRDFIHVSDIVRANLLAMEKEEANYQVFNVGTGRPKTVLEIADILIKKLHAPLTPKIVNKYRQGDIRHCYADISKIQKKLGFKPEVKFEDGISELVDWLRGEEALDQFEKSRWELEEKGLTT